MWGSVVQTISADQSKSGTGILKMLSLFAMVNDRSAPCPNWLRDSLKWLTKLSPENCQENPWITKSWHLRFLNPIFADVTASKRAESTRANHPRRMIGPGLWP
uniref:Uncharacterized protein n=1 Tax=Cacopsylla melanoneura TaxID=428564 RepID=A0A8D8RYE8_9HEMI